MKYALDLVERNASVDDAPVVICSVFIESDSWAIPSMETVKGNVLFAPLLYYKLSVPVVPLPQSLTDGAIQEASRFLREAAQNHVRFLVVADQELSYKTLDWFAHNAVATHSMHKLGVFDGMEVVEFVPRAGS
jgi:hypothetical protein